MLAFSYGAEVGVTWKLQRTSGRSALWVGTGSPVECLIGVGRWSGSRRRLSMLSAQRTVRADLRGSLRKGSKHRGDGCEGLIPTGGFVDSYGFV
jgi:hypothetical protein